MVVIYYNGVDYYVICVQRMFTIDPHKMTLIYKAWRTRAGNQLHDIFYDICKNDASTHWLTEDILQALKAYWDSPEYKAKQVNRESA